jgi:hypothetical protein
MPMSILYLLDLNSDHRYENIAKGLPTYVNKYFLPPFEFQLKDCLHLLVTTLRSTPPPKQIFFCEGECGSSTQRP